MGWDGLRTDSASIAAAVQRSVPWKRQPSSDTPPTHYHHRDRSQTLARLTNETTPPPDPTDRSPGEDGHGGGRYRFACMKKASREQACSNASFCLGLLRVRPLVSLASQTFTIETACTHADTPTDCPTDALESWTVQHIIAHCLASYHRPAGMHRCICVSAIVVLLSLLLRAADLPGHPSRVSSRGAIVCLLVVYMSMWFFARTIPSVPHPPCVPHDQTSQTYAAEPMRRNYKAFWVESTVQGLYMPSPRSISAAQRSCMY